MTFANANHGYNLNLANNDDSGVIADLKDELYSFNC